MAEVTRWLPRILVRAVRNWARVSPCSFRRRRAAVPAPSSTSASTRCSTDTYSSLRRVASRSAASSSRARRWVPITCPGGAPGPVTPGRTAQALLHCRAEAVRVGPGSLQQPWRQAVGLVEQGQQQMLAIDLGVAEAQRLGLGAGQGFLGLLGGTV